MISLAVVIFFINIKIDLYDGWFKLFASKRYQAINQKTNQKTVFRPGWQVLLKSAYPYVFIVNIF